MYSGLKLSCTLIVKVSLVRFVQRLTYYPVERAILHEEGLEREADRKRTVRGLQPRLDLRDIKDPRFQLYVQSGAGRTVRLLQQEDERVGRNDERAAGSEGGSGDRGSDHHVRSGTGGRLHHAVHESR